MYMNLYMINEAQKLSPHNFILISLTFSLAYTSFQIYVLSLYSFYFNTNGS
jgi:hypothetical protein